MISEFLAAISIKITVHTLRNTIGSTMSLCLYSLPHSGHATLSFLFSYGISISKKDLENKWGFSISQNFRKKELNCLKKLPQIRSEKTMFIKLLNQLIVLKFFDITNILIFHQIEIS